jgi:hypothetical protein
MNRPTLGMIEEGIELYIPGKQISIPFDPGKPIKEWIDSHPVDAEDATEKIFLTYERIEGKVKRKRFLVPVGELGRFNIPQGEAPRGLTEYPIPCRELKPGEEVDIDPFGKIFLKGPSGPVELSVVLDKLETIEKLLRELVARGQQTLAKVPKSRFPDLP